MHPLYDHATRLVGKPVYVYHATGQVYHGTLQSVVPTGIWVHLSGQPATPANSVQTPFSASHALLVEKTADNDLAPVFWPAAFFAFGALTGLAVAALAYPYYW